MVIIATINELEQTFESAEKILNLSQNYLTDLDFIEDIPFLEQLIICDNYANDYYEIIKCACCENCEYCKSCVKSNTLKYLHIVSRLHNTIHKLSLPPSLQNYKLEIYCSYAEKSLICEKINMPFDCKFEQTFV